MIIIIKFDSVFGCFKLLTYITIYRERGKAVLPDGLDCLLL